MSSWGPSLQETFIFNVSVFYHQGEEGICREENGMNARVRGVSRISFLVPGFAHAGLCKSHQGPPGKCFKCGFLGPSFTLRAGSTT